MTSAVQATPRQGVGGAVGRGGTVRATRQGIELAKMVKWYSPSEVLTMATGTNAELLKLSGRRDPYPGKLGVVEEGALADLLLVEGDPLTNLKLIEDAAKNFVVIMKDGRIFKNLVAPAGASK